MVQTTSKARPPGILNRVTCPHCWEHFTPEKMLWVAEHTDLLGDHRLGAEQAQRFLPTRFTVRGEAIDGKGFPCHQLACPNCHLIFPRPLLEMEPLFLSIFGVPASGKSYFLAAMTWELRKVLPLSFRMSFADADPVMNRDLNDYEESLFAGPSTNEPVPLASLIRKTEEQGDLYDTVSYGNQSVRYPRPFLFSVQPQIGHPNYAKADRLGRIVTLYDNAGESFQPGKDTSANPVTRHMAQSRVLFFVFDPTQDSRVKRKLEHPEIAGTRSMRQEPIFQEAAARIRRYSGLRQSDRHTRPLIVILTKFDAWNSLLGGDIPSEPWKTVEQDQNGSSSPMSALDVAKIERQSRLAREMLLNFSPEIVTAAEGFAEDVIYVPVSAVGWKVRYDDTEHTPVIRLQDTEPYWATVPLLYGLHRSAPGLIPVLARR